jgi:hypothetical protein
MSCTAGGSVTELFLADGPTRYLGGSIETFALPYGAFIVIATALYFIFKRPHSVPRMRYLTPAHQIAAGTREPGTAGMIRLRGAMPASAVVTEAETGVPGLQPPHASETLQTPHVLPETDFTHPAGEAHEADEAHGPHGAHEADDAHEAHGVDGTHEADGADGAHEAEGDA